MNTKNVLIGLGVVVLLVLGLIFPRSGGTVVERIVGANAGPDSTSPYNSFNGVEYWSYSTKFNNASTTLCSFKSPGATTTLSHFSAQITTATSSAIVVDFGSASIYDATTTLLASTHGVDANAQDTLVASSTSANTAQNFVIAPNRYLNVKFGTGPITLTTNSIGGTCKAVLIKN